MLSQRTVSTQLPQRYRAYFFTAASLFVLSAGTLLAQARHPVSGRVIAPVMGAAGADWLVRPERAAEENPDLAIKLLNFQPGMTVADIGAGVGYYSLKIASLVGPAGNVYASDIQPEMLRMLRRRIEKAKVKNVVPVLATETSTGIEAGILDLALLVDVYHEFSRPQAMLKSLRDSLKPDGRLVLLEFRKEDPNVPIREEHKMSVATAKQELEAEGFVLEKVLPDLPWQHILIFRKAGYTSP